MEAGWRHWCLQTPHLKTVALHENGLAGEILRRLRRWKNHDSYSTEYTKTVADPRNRCHFIQFAGMVPSATTEFETDHVSPALGLQLPENAAKRLSKAGIDLKAYPARPTKPEFLDQVYAIRSEYR